MRRFFEVFKTLKLPEDIGMYMENVEVTRVSKTSTNSLARLYIKNDRVISKKHLKKVLKKPLKHGARNSLIFPRTQEMLFLRNSTITLPVRIHNQTFSEVQTLQTVPLFISKPSQEEALYPVV